MKLKVLRSILFVVLAVFLFSSCKKSAGEVEVLHWWTSGGEAKSVAVLKDLLEKEGHKWKDFPVAGGGGDAAMTVLKSRAVAGNPPTAAQVKGPQIQLWAEQGFLANLDDVAEAENWDKLIPKQIADIMKYKGHYVAVPVNVHRINWMWTNPEVFKKAGAKVPKTWTEFEAAAKKIQAAGLIPIAWGGQPWQEATVFESIVAAEGTDFYNKTMVKADPASLNSAKMIKVLETFKMLKQYTDKGAPNRDWNLATAMVYKGEAGVQFMGDWAKGEFTAAKKTPGTDYLAPKAPGTDNMFLFNVDSFIMFKQKDPEAEKAQKAMARLIMQEEFQKVFNVNKGSIPVRMGMSEEPFDDVARTSMKDFIATAKSGGLVPSMAHEMAVMPAIKGAIQDVVSNYYNSDSMTAKEAAAQLAKAVKAAK